MSAREKRRRGRDKVRRYEKKGGSWKRVSQETRRPSLVM